MESFLSGRTILKASPPAIEGEGGGASQFKSYLPIVRPVEPALVPVVVAKEDLLNQSAPLSPSVELQEVNGVIRRIVVTCSCCRTIELDCLY